MIATSLLAGCTSDPGEAPGDDGNGDGAAQDGNSGADSGGPATGDTPSDGSTEAIPAASSAIQHVFVIAMENHAASQIYNNTAHAPYINNTLLPMGGHATNLVDVLAPKVPSEPHYVWMEAGTNNFADHTFGSDDPPSATNSTASKLHLSTQLVNAGKTWRSYQEGLNTTSGGCPIAVAGNYAPKHDPFIFFRDVSGSPPAKGNAFCIAHHKPLSALAADLANNTVAAYNFITPNLCHDMHSNSCPGSADPIKQGDDWLRATVPGILSYIGAHNGALFIIWDEPENSGMIPLIVVGTNAKHGFTSAVKYTHGSLVKTVEHIFGLSTLATVSANNTFADFFSPGTVP